MTKKQKILSGIGAVAFVAMIYFAYEFLMYTTTDNAQVEAHSVMIAAKVGGFVTEVNVTEGQKVKKGEVLASIDARDYQNVLTQMKGELSSLEASRGDSERNYQRLKGLLSSGAVSQAQFDTASATYQSSRARYEGLNAQVAQASLNLENTKVIAPADGFIARKSVEIGQLASPGVPLFGFVSNEERWLTANFKETEIEGVKLGAKAHISVDAVSSKSFEGKVVAISAATGATFTLLPPDNATGNFTKVVQRVPVKIEFVNLKEGDLEILRAGLSADVKVSKH
jgi:membrane fusion protein (multidrug efflux system)